MSEKTIICPRCQETWTGFPALGRVDNKTEVCSPCGVQEGLDDCFGNPLIAYNM
jgi:RNA polymerase subunit RPABC4/transcription elongation factor Spt4